MASNRNRQTLSKAERAIILLALSNHQAFPSKIAAIKWMRWELATSKPMGLAAAKEFIEAAEIVGAVEYDAALALQELER